ncbi:hypothetical protein PbB2_02566 [Candidatus Phycosocius bacilliformis]|uniref:Uncharacterized protein n=1 Tax=Candidatus Phycosocius bacilliformis TaxID=1445552 RepID=A0A2P2ECT5_9PROT|nr:hypothetical protein [Candidatus Phycosocius bacilliformis]GBF58877.1 hypothetical protein PbB2_02566 [Candidatus Phycosocius bacilliformis]
MIRNPLLALSGCAILAGTLAATPLMAASVANKATANSTATTTSANTTTTSNGAVGEANIVDNRMVDVVVVWGFRVRTNKFDERRPSLTAGYGDLVKKPECQTSVCGFVVFHDGEKWRYTNVLAGSEDQLRALQGDLEYDRQTLVIVHPNGERRSVPQF